MDLDDDNRSSTRQLFIVDGQRKMNKDIRKCILGPFLQIFIYRAKWLIWTITR